MTHTITRESCRAANACWSDDDLAKTIPPQGLSPAEVASREDVRLVDRVWALTNAAGMSPRDQRLFACRTARRALSRVASPDPRSVHAIDVAERYAVGEATDEELAAAFWGARAYVTYVACADADAADAAYTAAYAAYVDAARVEERRVQLADLVAVLSGRDV